MITKNNTVNLNTLLQIKNEYLLIQTLNVLTNNEVLQEWLQKDKRSSKIIVHLDILKIIQNNIKIPYEITSNKSFVSFLFSTIIDKSESLIDIRSYLYLLEKNDYELVEQLTKKLNNYTKEIIDSYNPNNNILEVYNRYLSNNEIPNEHYLFSSNIQNDLKKFMSKEEKLTYLKQETSLKLSEIIIDSLFQDNIYNVRLNINEILRYTNDTNKNLIEESHLNFYKAIINIDNIPNEEKIFLYNTLKDKNISSMFYDDLKILKKNSYQEILNSLIQIKEYDSLKNRELSNQYQTDIYELNGEEFYMLVKSMDPISNNSSSSIENQNPNNLIERGCYSLISHDNISVFSGKMIYGFDTFDINHIISVFESDCMSRSNILEPTGEESERIINENYGTLLVNRIMTPSQIVNGLEEEKQVGYSEIQIIGKLKPSYIVAFDGVNNFIITESKKLNIPIIIINKSKYRNKKEEVSPSSNEELMYIDFTSKRESFLKSKRKSS